MIKVFAPREAEIGTTARFVICWHEHADPIRYLMLLAKRKTSTRSEYFTLTRRGHMVAQLSHPAPIFGVLTCVRRSSFVAAVWT